MRIAAFNRSKSLENISKLSAAQSNSIGVQVTDLDTNTITTYHAIIAAARALSLDKRYIEHYIYLNKEKPVLARYTFKLLNPKSVSLDLGIKVQKTSHKLEVRLLMWIQMKLRYILLLVLQLELQDTIKLAYPYI